MNTNPGRTPVLQAEIRDAFGQWVGRVDFLLAERGVIVEFDGALKYAGQTAAPLVREKRREDALRDLGYEVVRSTWATWPVPPPWPAGSALPAGAQRTGVRRWQGLLPLTGCMAASRTNKR